MEQRNIETPDMDDYANISDNEQSDNKKSIIFKGLEISGEYIKIMFSDDWFTFSDSLSKLVGLLEDDPDADLAFSGSRQVILDENEADNLRHLGEKNKRKAYDRAPEEGYVNKLKNDFRYLFVSNQIGAPSDAIYRRGDKAALFDEKSNWASDVFLFMDILVKNPKFNSTTEPLISIGIHSGQYTEGFDEKDERVYNDYRYMYEKYGLSHSSMCRRHMAKEYVIKWHKGYAEADSLGIGRGLYTAMCLRELVLTVKSFVLSRLRRIAKGNTAS